MSSKAYVELALKILSCSQKELASRLGVSPTQISKWKQDDHMSHDMEKKISTMLQIGDEDPEFILMAGSIEDARKWDRLIHFLAKEVLEGSETGYNTYPLEDDMGLLNWHTLKTLSEMGITLPTRFPKELDFNYETYCDTVNDEEYDEKVEAIWALLDDNPYSSVIKKIFKALTNVYGFYAAHIEDLVDDESLELSGTTAINIEPCLMTLAACKIEVNKEFAPKLSSLQYQTKKEYVEWLNIVKDRAFRAGAPLTAELLNLVFQSDEALRNAAEAESFGVNADRLHPDIYMNELLCGMRVIHQVLPVIMKKLGIYDEFQLDESELRAGA